MNINQEGLSTELVTIVNHEHNDINPDYGAIATGAAVTGFIAGLVVVGGEWLEGYTGEKPTLETSELDHAVTKPTQALVDKYPELFQDFTNSGVMNPNALNTGLGNFVDDIALINLPVNHLTLVEAISLNTTEAYTTWVTSSVYEGGWLMKPIEQTIGGVHYMSLFHDKWSHVAGYGGAMTTITIVPAIPVTYCAISPSMCAGVVSPPPSKPKSKYDFGVSMNVDR